MIGREISHYRVVDKLGEGGMGVVYKAEDLRLGRTVALKFLASHLLGNEDARKRFVREAKAVAALDHPNICTLYEIDEADDGAFMAMAYLEGQTLEQRIAEGPLPLPVAIDIAKQVAKGLQEAHRKSLLHRDIKPSNIFLVQTGSNELLVKILDFGLARGLGQTQLTRVDSTVGTAPYMSPEQTQDSAVDHRSDIWALGVVLYEMVTGSRPFRGDYDSAVIYSITCEEPEPLTAVRAGVPMQLDWIVGKALAKDPEARYQSCVELMVDLDTVARRLGEEASRPATAVRSMPRPVAPSTVGQPVPAGEATATSPKRRVRDTVLHLSSQGVLPDRVLTQTLEILNRPDSDEAADESAARRRLLDDLADNRVRVGEFLDQWHEIDSREAVAATPADGKSKKPGKDARSKAEIFGYPIYVRCTGKDPASGKEKVATGVIAIGNIAVGVVAVGSWAALGAVAISPVSIGLWALGLAAVGLKAVGFAALSLSDLAWWQGLLVALGVGAGSAVVFHLRKRGGSSKQGGDVSS